MAALSEPARPVLFGTGAATRLARDLRHRIPFCSRRVDHPALRDLHPVPGLHRPRADRDDSVVQRDADLAVDGLRPRDGEHADPDGEPAAALVPADRQAARRMRPLGDPGLCVSGDRAALGHRSAVVRLHHRASGASAVWADDGSARIAAVLGDPAAGELCQRDELRDLPDVFRLLGTLPAVARQRGEPLALLCLSGQSLHPCRRADPLRALWSARASLGYRSRRCDRDLSDARGLWIRSGKGADAAARSRLSWRFGPPAAFAALAVALIATAAPQSEDPDWPCQQRLVPKLTPAAYWNGPLDMQGDWRADPAVAGLVRQLAPRPVTVEEGLAAIMAFAKTVSDDRTHRFALAFRGLLAETDSQRADLIEKLK